MAKKIVIKKKKPAPMPVPLTVSAEPTDRLWVLTQRRDTTSDSLWVQAHGSDGRPIELTDPIAAVAIVANMAVNTPALRWRLVMAVKEW